MKRSISMVSFFVLAFVIGLSTLSLWRAQAQGRGGRGSPEAQAARAKQAELERTTPQLQITEEVLPLDDSPDIRSAKRKAFAEIRRVICLSIRVRARAEARAGARQRSCLSSTRTLNSSRNGPDNYAASFAHSVRVDKYDNVWMVDEGSGMIVKFDPNGMVKMALGRKPEAIDYLEGFLERGEKKRTASGRQHRHVQSRNRRRLGFERQYLCQRRLRQFAPRQDPQDGIWVGSVGTYGSGPDQFNTPHGIASDANDNIYVGDRGNNRVQVYNTESEAARNPSPAWERPGASALRPARLNICTAATASAAKYINSTWTASCWAGPRPASATARTPA